MRWVGVLGISVTLAAGSAEALDNTKPCFGAVENRVGANDLPSNDAEPVLTHNECEALKARELHVPLLEIPQDREAPMELSVGVKHSSGLLRFKIPFSF